MKAEMILLAEALGPLVKFLVAIQVTYLFNRNTFLQV